MLLPDILIAALGGAAVGFERQRSGKVDGPDARFGGLRTFTLLGLAGGIAGALGQRGWLAVAAALVFAAAAIAVIGYLARSDDDIDGTTEVAALVVVAAGTLAGSGDTVTASAIVAGVTLLLVEKARLHALTRRLDDAALTASARFAVLALVVLPLLPSGGYGPDSAIRPRELWVFVLFFSALSFGAWIARRWLGAAAGTLATGLLGGLISSTSVTLLLARASRERPGDRSLAAASIAASTLMLARVLTAAAVLDPSLATAFVPFALPLGAIGLAGTLLTLRHRTTEAPLAAEPDRSPLQFRTAVQMAVSFAVVVVAIDVVTAQATPRLFLATAAAAGATDIDALTLSMARRSAGITASEASRALAAGVAANTVVKLLVATVVGRGAYRGLVPATLGLMVATTGTLLYFW